MSEADSRVWCTMTDLVLHTCSDVAALARGFVTSVAVAGDPFARPLLLVPGSGMQRWLSQQLARYSSSDGEGISAGLDTHRVASLEQLIDPASRDDPWLPERLVWSVLDAVDAGEAGLEPLIRHLSANDQRYANALRVARLLRRYTDYRPSMLAAWAAEGDPTGLSPTEGGPPPDPELSELGFHSWQRDLWRALQRRVSSPDPVERRLALIERVRSGQACLPWPVVHVFAPRITTSFQREVLAAASTQVPVHVWLPTADGAGVFTDIAGTLGARSGEWLAQWRSVAGHVEAAEPSHPALQPRLSLHTSHALGRQTEVLREVLTGAFADDPTLEPREVVILTPDPGAVAPYVAALFTPPADSGDAGRWVHPGTQLRVQAAEGAQENQVHSLLRDLLQLRATRASASQLLALAAHPFVARQFGFDADALNRLEKLVDAAAIRWGINAEHRAAFGLGGVPQSTWQLGVQRLILGEVFSDDDRTSVGVVATVDDVASTDADLIGALAELVSRTSRIVRSFSEAGTPTEWADRLRTAVELMADVPFAELWQFSQLGAALDEIRTAGEASNTRLHAGDALAMLNDTFRDRGARPSVGSGSLVVASLESLARVPHRVVCLVGLDERTFPRRGLGDGDDLLLVDRQPGDPDPGADDRQALLDAVLSASDRLIVIYQGESSLTPERQHPPAAVADLIDVATRLGSTVSAEPLQPFSPTAFAKGQSFDADALRAARALTRPRLAAPDRHAVGFAPRSEPLTSITLDQLEKMLRNPGTFFLRERAGLTIGSDDPLPESIPVEVGFLDRWQMGQAMLDGLMAGRSLDDVVTAAWLSGHLPPRELGSKVVEEIAKQAGEVHAHLLREAAPAAETSEVDLEFDGVRVTGRVVTRGSIVAMGQFGWVDARQFGPAWVRLLALTAERDRRTDALLVGRNGLRRLIGPPVEVARDLLADLVHLAQHATEQILPLPPQVGEFWARERAAGRDPRQSTGLEKLWDWEATEWEPWWTKDSPPWRERRRAGDPWGEPGEDTTLGALAVRVYGPIVQAQPQTTDSGRHAGSSKASAAHQTGVAR